MQKPGPLASQVRQEGEGDELIPLDRDPPQVLRNLMQFSSRHQRSDAGSDATEQGRDSSSGRVGANAPQIL